jgi:hypothetical protein
MANTEPKRRFRFSLRLLLAVLVLLAVGLTFGPKVNDWFYAVPLSDVIDNFNIINTGDDLGTRQAPINEEEVIRALETEIPKLPTDNTGSKAKRIYQRIIRTRQLPLRSKFRVITITRVAKYATESRHVWYVDLNVITNDNTSYQVRVRQDDDPALP